MIHFAPEPFFESFFQKVMAQYKTADLFREDVDYQINLTNLPFDDNSYDLIYASHVLEHIKDDEKAIQEIYRVLRPGGVAFLPVPLISEVTVEYPEPNPHEEHHVRAPGRDYFEKYRRVFSRVDEFSSDMFPEKYQTFIYEKRSQWPNQYCPLRPPMLGEKHIDVVPVCHAFKGIDKK